MKSILILSHAMELGGAEKSLLGLLNAIDSKKYQVDLFLMRHEGSLLEDIPENINLLPEIPAYTVLARPLKDVIKERHFILALADFYLVGQRICMNNVKVAGGVFWQDRYVAFLQAIVNLVVSVVMINKIGLPGVYVGTIVQGLISTIIKPIIVYKDLFKVSPFLYFKQGLGNLIVVVAAYIVSLFICNTWLMENTILNFVLRMLIVVIVPNLIFVGAYFRTKEFAYLKNTILRIVKRK